MTKIHIIPHTHWDREWYFTAENSKVLLIDFMDELFKILENNDRFKYFILDGQSVILDDYLEIRPEDKEKIVKYVKEGRLLVGPWYTQTDELIVSGESIVRNLYYGIDTAKEFGNYMKIGYLPDSFGQSAQIPQILQGFDIDRSVFWRGLCELDTENTEFRWQSPDGSEVFAVNLPLGYAIGKYLTHEIEETKDKIYEIMDKIQHKATTENVLIPNGHDQMPIQKDLTYLVDGLNQIGDQNEYIVSNFDNYIDNVLEEKEKFDIVQGELTHQKNMRIHRSIYSTRYDIKKANVSLENLITNHLEPLLTIAWKLGLPYRHNLIEKAWKEIFKSQAHDSLGCCCTDQVHKKVKDRFEIANDICENLLELNMRKIADRIDTEYENSLVIFNTLPYERSEIVKVTFTTEEENFIITDKNGKELEYQIVNKELIDIGTIDRRIAHQGDKLFLNKIEVMIKVDNVPSLGYKSLSILPVEKDIEKKRINSNDNQIDNDYFNIKAKDDGSLDIYDKVNEKNLTGFLIFRDGGDAGDEYNYSPPKNDYIITTLNNKAEIEVVRGKVMQELVINQKLNIPKNLEDRNKEVKNVEMPIEIRISLKDDSELINVKVKVLNNAYSHRLRALFKTDISTEFSYADQQFGIIKRNNKPPELRFWKEEGWSEKPVPIYPMQSFVDLNDGDYGLAIITNGIREYEIIGNDFDTIALTLFRSIGIIGQPNLVNRPGRASGVGIETPDSQMIGELEFEFAIYPHKGDTIQGKVAKTSKKYLTPMVGYHKTDYHIFRIRVSDFDLKKDFPKEYSLLKLDSDLVISTIKKAEKSDEIILRLFNPGSEIINSGKVKLKDGVLEKIYTTNLKEENLIEIEKKNNTFDLGNFNSCQVKTFKVK